jgi:hypothetical protein
MALQLVFFTIGTPLIPLYIPWHLLSHFSRITSLELFNLNGTTLATWPPLADGFPVVSSLV